MLQMQSHKGFFSLTCKLVNLVINTIRVGCHQPMQLVCEIFLRNKSERWLRRSSCQPPAPQTIWHFEADFVLLSPLSYTPFTDSHRVDRLRLLLLHPSKFVLGHLAQMYSWADMFHGRCQCLHLFCQWPFAAAVKTDMQKATPWSAVPILFKTHPDQNTP